MNAAEELRAAASKIRKTADGAQDGPWRIAKGLPDDSVRTESGWEVAYSAFSHGGNLSWIALAHPGLAEPLATWLEREAAWAENFLANEDALAVAITINGGGE